MKSNTDFVLEFNKKIEEISISMINEKLSLITDIQKEFFLRLYPNGAEGIKQNDRAWAYSQLCRTIQDNEKGDV